MFVFYDFAMDQYTISKILNMEYLNFTLSWIKYQMTCFYLFFLFTQEYFEFIERERIHAFETLALKYRAIGPLLTKMEGLVVHTNSGRSPRLHAYYAYWERKVFDTLTRVSWNIGCVCNVKSMGSNHSSGRFH